MPCGPGYRSVLLTSFLHAAINTQALGAWHLLVRITNVLGVTKVTEAIQRA